MVQLERAPETSLSERVLTYGSVIQDISADMERAYGGTQVSPEERNLLLSLAERVGDLRAEIVAVTQTHTNQVDEERGE